ncbi:MAG: transcription termination factor NusA [Phycisphaerales bacterium]
MSNEMLRIIDSIARERNVDKESLVKDIEQAMVSAARKHFAALDTDEFSCEIDRFNGEIRIFRGQELIPLASLGRIPAQTAKQVMIQKFREDERASIYDEFAQRIGEVVTGVAQRYEGGSLVVQLGRAEGFMPRSEQIPGEQHIPGERVRCMILDVRDTGSQVKIVLTRANPDFIKRLFELEVPEVSERIIEVKALAREPGHRTKVAVSSIDSKVDAVGACVGVRGSRIKNIVDELAGEKIDIVRWNESSQVLIANALRPAEVVEISLCFELNRATVVVNEDQLSLAIGKRGQNVRLAARLTGWDVDILTPGEFAKGLDILEETLKTVEGFTEQMIDRLGALGVISVFDIEEVGADVLVEQLKEFELQRPSAERAVVICSEKAKEVAVQQQLDREEAERRKRMEMAGQAVEMDAAEAQASAILGGPSAGSAGSGPAPGSISPATGAGSVTSGGGGGILDMLINRTATNEEPAGQAGDDRPHDVALADEQAHTSESDSDGAPSDPHPVDGDPTGDPYDNDVARLARGEVADGDESDERSPS